MAAEVDPDLVALLAARSAQDRYVAATVVFRESIHPNRPSTDAGFLRFEQMVHDLIERITDATDRAPDWVYPSPLKRGCELLAPASFVVQLVQEPEVSGAFKGLILADLADLDPCGEAEASTSSELASRPV